MWDRIYRRVLAGIATLAGAILIFTAASINFEVVMRYFRNQPTTWVVDFAEFSLLYVTFLAAAWVLSREGHVRIEVLVERLPRGARLLMNTITSAIGALLCGLFFWLSLRITLEAFAAQSKFIGGANILAWPVLMVMPFGTLFIAIEFIRKTWQHARKSRGNERA